MADIECPTCGAKTPTDTCTTASGRDHKKRRDAERAYYLTTKVSQQEADRLQAELDRPPRTIQALVDMARHSHK